MCDIALGIKEHGLEEFAKWVDAAPNSRWPDLELYDEDVEGWGQAFEQALSRTMEAGGNIHFNLDGLDIKDALAGNPSAWTGRYTAWELQQLVRKKEWFERTIFYCYLLNIKMKKFL